MTGNLQDRPFLLLILRVMRPMLAMCAAAMLLVIGAIWYGVSEVQGRGLVTLTGLETVGLSILAALLVVSLLLFAGAGRILRQNRLDASQ